MVPGKDGKYILAIDHGTSAMKPAIVSVCGEVLGWESEEVPLHLYPGGGAEQDTEDWWRAFVTACRRLLDRELVPVEDIVAVCCSSQWSGTVAVNREGRALMNAIIWMDSRGAPHVKRAFGGFIKIAGYRLLDLIRWLRKTGGIPASSGKDPIAHILYIRDELPDIYRETHMFLEPKDYMNLRLTGKFAATFDSITLHWVTDNRDINNIHYDRGLIKRLGIDGDKLPPLVRSVDVLGPLLPDVADELGLSRQVKVVAGSPDLQSAVVGSGAVRDYEGHVYIGTSSWLTCHVPYKKTDISHNMASLPSAIPGRYFIANEQETAGACLTFLRDNIFYPDDKTRRGNPQVYREFDKLAEQAPPGSGGVIFTPWLYGERTPVEDHTIRGGFHNLSLEVNKSHLVRAVFEGVAYNSRWVFQAVEGFIKRRMDILNMIGGGAQSDIWCQIYADILNRTIRQVEDPIQANARGAAFIAAAGLGYITFDQIPSLIKIKRTYKPNPENRKVYDKLYTEFLQIYKNNKEMYRRLNQ